MRPAKGSAAELGGRAAPMGHEKESSTNCAPIDKSIATASARAALVGLELRQLEDGRFALVAGRTVLRTVDGLRAVEGALAGFEQVQAEVRALITSMRGAA